MAGLTRPWQPIPQALVLWLTAQLCCVWITPRIKQEVEIKQKLKHTRRHRKSRNAYTGRASRRRLRGSAGDGLWKRVRTLTCVELTRCSMIGVIILCLPQTRISPGRTTGISFLRAHTRARTYGRFTRLVPLGLSSPLHGGLLRLMRKTSKHAPSVSEHANAVTQTRWYFGYEMTRKHSKSLAELSHRRRSCSRSLTCCNGSFKSTAAELIFRGTSDASSPA